MTQPAYNDVKPYVDNGDANVDIAKNLSTITNGPITADVARTFFVENDWWLQGHDGPAGDFETAWDDLNLPSRSLSLKVLDALWNIVFQRARNDLETTTQQRPNGSAKDKQSSRFIKDLLDMLVSNGYTTQQKVTAFYDLGDGLKYPAGVSAAEVQQAIDDKTAQDARIAAYNAVTARANQATGAAGLAVEQELTPAEITAAAEAAWNAV